MRLLSNPFVLDTSNQSPLRGTKKIVLTPKIFAVPDFLLRNPHLLVAKTEVVATLWPGTKVVDVGLRVSIRKIRKALNENTKYPKFIDTVAKSGYRWIAPITPRSDTSNQVARPYRHMMIGGHADSISSGHTKESRSDPIPEPGSRSLTGLSCMSRR